MEQPEGQLKEKPVGKDVLEVPGHKRFRCLELKRSRWAVGKDLAKIYITSLGQQPFHAVNQVGTMFTVTDVVPALPREQKTVK